MRVAQPTRTGFLNLRVPVLEQSQSWPQDPLKTRGIQTEADEAARTRTQKAEQQQPKGDPEGNFRQPENLGHGGIPEPPKEQGRQKPQ